MKRDMELIRKRLMKLEDESSVDLSEYSEEAIGYHNWLLVNAGLATGFDSTTGDDDSPNAFLNSLTYAGHDFLDAARSETIWNYAKDQIKSAGVTMTIEIVKGLFKKYMLEKVGLPLN